MSACITLAALLDAYRSRLRTVLEASGQPIDIQVTDDLQPLDDQPSLVQSAGVAVWSSGTERQDLGSSRDQFVVDTIEIELSISTGLQQEDAFTALLQLEDAVSQSLLGGWDGAPCVALRYESTDRARSGADLRSVMTYESTRMVPGR